MYIQSLHTVRSQGMLFLEQFMALGKTTNNLILTQLEQSFVHDEDTYFGSSTNRKNLALMYKKECYLAIVCIILMLFISAGSVSIIVVAVPL